MLHLVDGEHALVEAGDGDVAVLVVQRGQEARERRGGVGHGAAVEARVQVARGATHGHLRRDEPAQAVAQRRHVGRGAGRVRDDESVGREVPAVRVEVVVHDVPAALLLALDDDLEVHRERAGREDPALRREDHRERRPLVVGASARADLAVDHRRLERRRLPLVERVGRLDVVVAVEQQRRPAVAFDPRRVDRRQPVAVEQPGLEVGTALYDAKPSWAGFASV